MTKKRGSPGLVRRLPVVIYCVELIFEYEYLHKYEAKIENTFTLDWGSYDVSLGINNSKNRIPWTIPLSLSYLTQIDYERSDFKAMYLYFCLDNLCWIPARSLLYLKSMMHKFLNHM